MYNNVLPTEEQAEFYAGAKSRITAIIKNHNKTDKKTWHEVARRQCDEFIHRAYYVDETITVIQYTTLSNKIIELIDKVVRATGGAKKTEITLDS